MTTQIFEFAAAHGYLLLFAFVFAEQIGLPIPSIPVLLAGGALARTGQIDLAHGLAVCIVAAMIADLSWYEFARRRGAGVLSLLCRISLEPDSCVRRTEELFGRHGARALLISKFVPAFNTVAPPMAGVFGMRRRRFLLFDLIGSLVWAGSFLVVGWLFGNEIERVAEAVSRFGGGAAVLMAGGLAAWIGYKFLQRQRFIRNLRVARITTEELRDKLERGEEIVIVDLRHSVDFEATPETIPGALHIPVEQFEGRGDEIPRGREIILFCT